MVIAAALTVASCSALPEASFDPQLVSGTAARAKTVSPDYRALSAPTVVTDKSPAQYHKDLEHCRSVAQRQLGAPSSRDDIPALKRALDQGITGSTLDVRYESTDLAVKRDYLVKKCISQEGYLVR